MHVIFSSDMTIRNMYKNRNEDSTWLTEFGNELVCPHSEGEIE